MSATLEHYAKALAGSSDSVGQRADSLLYGFRDVFTKPSGKLKILKAFSSASSILPKDEKGHAICQDSVQYITKLTEIAGLEKNAVIDFPVVCTADPLSGDAYITSCFTQIIDDTTAELDIKRHSPLSGFIESCTHRLPVAICTGCHPAITFAAVIPDIGQVGKLPLAGFLMERPPVMANCFTQDIKVPSDCHYVIEGYIQKSDTERLFHATAFTHRKDADPGCFTDESSYSCIYPPLELLAVRYLRAAISSRISDVHFTDSGIAAVRLDGHSGRNPESLALALWGTALFEDFHTILITDRECDLRSENDLSRIMEQALSEPMGFNGLKKLFYSVVE